MQEYADPVIDWLDGGRGLFAKKMYREVGSLSNSRLHSLAVRLTVSFSNSLVHFNRMDLIPRT